MNSQRPEQPAEFSIGSVRVAPNLVLAPMSGITDSIFRRTVKEANPGAVGLVVTELLSIEALCRGSEKTIKMLRSEAVEQPLSIQLFGSEPERMAEAARMAVEHGAAIVDINCGCPVPKVVTKGGGAELMRQPEKLGAMVRAIRRAVPVPVTVKIRAGWDDANRNAVEVATIVEGEGAAMVAVHGRTRRQLYTGEADWNLIGEVQAAVKIPVLGSGDITTAEEAVRRLRETGVAGIMIGRGALTNPWIFRQVAAAQRGEPSGPPTAREAWLLMAHLIERFVAELHPNAAVGRGRGLVCRMTKGLPHSATLRERITKAPSVEAILDILRERCDEAGEDPISRAA